MRITKRQLRRIIREELNDRGAGISDPLENTPQNLKNIIDAYIEDVKTTHSDEVNQSDLSGGPGAKRLIQAFKPVWLAKTEFYDADGLATDFIRLLDDAVFEAVSDGRLKGEGHETVGDGFIGDWYDHITFELGELWDDHHADRIAAEEEEEEAQWQAGQKEKARTPPRKKQPPPPPTKRQWQAVLNAMTKSYGTSYAMLVDDAMPGFSKWADKLNLLDTFDGEVFSFLFQKVKNFVKTLTTQDVQTLNDLFEQDENWGYP